MLVSHIIGIKRREYFDKVNLPSIFLIHRTIDDCVMPSKNVVCMCRKVILTLQLNTWDST